MRTVLDDEVDVSYSQIYVKSEDASPFGDMGDMFGGQCNGLCGAAWQGTLWLVTGLFYGRVGFRVEVHDERPDVDEGWEEIVEAPYRPVGSASLVEWGGGNSWDLGLADTDYRVRYSASGMDRAADAHSRGDDEPMIDRYLLQFWPCPPEPDRVVKQTSPAAAYWHKHVRTLPPPALSDPDEEVRWKAELDSWGELGKRIAAEMAAEEAAEAALWDGALPSPALMGVRGEARDLALAEQELTRALVAVGPDRQRRIAGWVARRAYQEIGIAELDWVAPALDAVEAGEALPPPFDLVGGAWKRLQSEPRVPPRIAPMLRAGVDQDSPVRRAVGTLYAALLRTPLHAVLAALAEAVQAFGADARFPLAELKEQLGVD
ncbi:hypothetical protein AQJ54_40130 [Streptomyces griseorubiginosus]|uniref:Uncharacterized protein n=1 Tax=Streptomyces griseorubiginosus TaxID=67304 RepID=A0A101RPD7_9ACTN|nr:hypothetical protein AQJ54_40130 [Streptomyces griseorubiginosus]